MRNSVTPAAPIFSDGIAYTNLVAAGLTKLELFCLVSGVPETGDDELDAIILKGNRLKVAAMALQGLLANPETGDAALWETSAEWVQETSEASVEFADALLVERGMYD